MSSSKRQHPNIVFILMDDLGWMDLACQGNRYHETPHLDRLAAEGVRFTQAYATAAICSPTRASLLTGQTPARLNLTDFIGGHHHPWAKLTTPDWTRHLPEDQRTLPQTLGSAGYRSYFVGKWHLGKEPHTPASSGFDSTIAGSNQGQPPSWFSPFGLANLEDGAPGEYLTDRLTDEAVTLLRDHRSAHADQPFYLQLCHYAPHTPLDAKDKWIAHYARKADMHGRHSAVYAAMIHSVDESVGRILAELEDLGIADDTLVVFTSDHGALHHSTPNTPLRHGKATPYEGGLRVPLIVRGPGIARGRVCDEPNWTCDHYPTLLEACGLPTDPEQHRDGRSLMPRLTDHAEPTPHVAPRDLCWHYPHYHLAPPYAAIRRGRYKLIEWMETGRCELYDLWTDPSETTDLRRRATGVANALLEGLRQWQQASDAQPMQPNPDYDPDRRYARNTPSGLVEMAICGRADRPEP